MKKRIVATLLAVTMAFPCNIVSASENEFSFTYEDGITMSADTFDQIYCSGENKVSPTSMNEAEMFQATVRSIDLDKDRISITLTLETLSDIESFTIYGDLYNGFYKESFVGDMSSTSSNYRVVLFGLYGSESNDTLLVDQTLSSQEHMKLYLADKEDNLYFIEEKAPLNVRSVTAYNDNNGNVQDVSWFVDFATPIESGSIPTTNDVEHFMEFDNPELLNDSFTPYASTSQWVAPTTYYQTFSISSDVLKYWSVPYGTYHLPTSISDNSTTATTTFRVREHMTLNGTTYSDRENILHYRNVRMDMAYPTGAEFRNMAVDGCVQNGGSLNSFGDSIKGMTGYLISGFIPSYSTYIDIAKAVWNLTNLKSVTHRFGSDVWSLLNGGAASISYQLTSKYEIYNDSTKSNAHNLILQGDVQSETDTTKSDTAVASFSWDVYDSGDTYIQNGSKSVSVKYTVVP